MKTNIFNGLIEKLECQSWEINGSIGFSAKFNNYGLSFYADAEDGFKLMVEDFGRMMSDKWEQLEPSKKQLEKMQKIINEKADSLHTSEETEERYDVRAEQSLYTYGY